MTAIIIPRKRSTQPQGAFTLARPADFLLLPQKGAVDLVSGLEFTGGPYNLSPVASRSGCGFNLSAGSGQYWSAVGPGAVLNSKTQLCIVGVITPKTITGNDCILGNSTAVGTSAVTIWADDRGFASAITNMMTVDFSGLRIETWYSSLLPGRTSTFVINYISGKRLAVWIDGVLHYLTGDPPSITREGQLTLRLGGGLAINEFDGALDLLYISNSALATGGEEAELSNNPWQLFHAEPTRFYILGAEPVPNTIDLSGVSFGMASFPTTQTAITGLSYIDVGVSPATLQAIFGANLGSVPVLLSPKNTQLSNTLGVGESGIGMGVGDLTFPESNNIEMIGSSFDMGEENVELKQQASVGSTSFNVDGTDTSAYQRLVFSATNIDFNTGLLDLPLIITNGSSQLNDAIFFKLRSMGYEGSLNKMVHKYFLDNGASDKVSVMQAEREWLVARGVAETVSVRDMYKAHLSASGYSGTFNDALLKFWNDV